MLIKVLKPSSIPLGKVLYVVSEVVVIAFRRQSIPKQVNDVMSCLLDSGHEMLRQPVFKAKGFLSILMSSDLMASLFEPKTHQIGHPVSKGEVPGDWFFQLLSQDGRLKKFESLCRHVAFPMCCRLNFGHLHSIR